MNKKEIIRILEKIALYMEIKGENPFKISAFRKAALALENDERSMTEIDDVTKIKGIGKGTAAVIADLLATGESEVLTSLQQEVPATLLDLLKVQGLGGKKIAKLYSELGIDSLASLQAACEAQEVRQLAGFAAKTEEKILMAIAELAVRAERHPHWRLEPVVTKISQILADCADITKYSVAGSYRRTNETSKDIDFIIATTVPQQVRAYLLAHLSAKAIIAAGDTKVSLTLDEAEPIDVDFRLVTPEEYATALHHFTGSKEHNVRLRQMAKESGEKISEYGVTLADGTIKTFEDETAFFAHFNLPFIPPTLRAGNAEFEHYDKIAELITPQQIVSDLHMHTTWSDGAHAVHEMGGALIAKGYSHAVITDHSQYLKVANGLTPERLFNQRKEIEAFNVKHPEFTLFAGTEMDILPDGTLDFADDVLQSLDFVIASIHSSFTQPREQIMARLHNAISHPYVHMIAHPTGRVIEQREGYDVDIPQLIAWAKEYGKILELNANPYRLDLCVAHLQLAYEAGVPVAINTDAHAIEQLRFMTTGVHYAQKAWLPTTHIVNTWTKEKFEAFIRQHK